MHQTLDKRYIRWYIRPTAQNPPLFPLRFRHFALTLRPTRRSRITPLLDVIPRISASAIVMPVHVVTGVGVHPHSARDGLSEKLSCALHLILYVPRGVQALSKNQWYGGCRLLKFLSFALLVTPTGD